MEKAPPIRPETQPAKAGSVDREVVEAYERHAPELFRYAVGIGHDAERARDAIQEVFLRYFLARGEGQEIYNPKSWLYRVLHNHMLDLARAAAGTDELCLEQQDQRDEQGLDPERRMLHKQALERFVNALSPQEMKCLQLRAGGLPYEEIARVLAIRPGTVGSVLNRARAKIRKALAASVMLPDLASETPVSEVRDPQRPVRAGVRRLSPGPLSAFAETVAGAGACRRNESRSRKRAGQV